MKSLTASEPSDVLMVCLSYGRPCGVGEYTAALVGHMGCKGTREYDWNKISLLIQGKKVLHIQYHAGLDYHSRRLSATLEQARMRGIKTVMTIHSPEWIERFVGNLDLVIVHNAQTKLRLSGKLKDVPIAVIPIPIPDMQPTTGWANTKPTRGRPCVGTFGFLLPHKRIYELIWALAEVKKHHDSVQLLAVCTTSRNNTTSLKYLRKCRQAADETGVNVEFFTEYHELGTVNAILNLTDVNVMNYVDIPDCSSAAARVCLASRRPLIVSTSTAFKDIPEDCVIRSRANKLSSNIEKLFLNKKLSQQKSDSIGRYIERCSYGNVVGMHMEAYNK